MGNRFFENLLILTKTYPSPSSKYRETTCVAALNSSGEMRRIFPVPFRLLEGRSRFTKWEWIKVSTSITSDDNRPESRHIDIESIERMGIRIGTKLSWADRRRWIMPHIIEGFSLLEARRQDTGATLGFIQPLRLVELQIKKQKETDWTERDKTRLLQEGLFDSKEVKNRSLLKKLPYDFYYRYESSSNGETCIYKHKIVDWEVGALFWNCLRKHGRNWEEPFRNKLESELPKKDLMFLMGTIHRFPGQWLIVGLFYPPKRVQESGAQLSLGLSSANA